jgi:CheY-like chemotaxis protein
MSGLCRPRVLVVEDDQDVGLALHRILYEDRDEYDVLLTGSAERAREIMAEVRVEVVVTDIRLPGMSGLDLLSWAARDAPDTRAIVITAFDLESIRDRAHAFGCVRLLRKPFEGDELRATIRLALEHRDGVGGALSDLSFADVVQSFCLARRTLAIRVFSGQDSGAVYVDKGDVINATWQRLVGEEAFYRMLALQGGRFCTAPLPADITRLALPAWQHLLLEGTRRMDEPCPPTLSSRREVGTASMPQEIASEVSRLIDEGFDRLRAGRREDARFAWEHALELDPSNKAIELNLRKLSTHLGASSRLG